MGSKVLIPVRYSAWLSGDLGRQIQECVQQNAPKTKVTLMPRGLLVESDTLKEVSVLKRAVGGIRAAEEMCRTRFPVFHQEMGTVWTGTAQVIYQE